MVQAGLTLELDQVPRGLGQPGLEISKVGEERPQKELVPFSLFSFHQAIENSNLIPLPLDFSSPGRAKPAVPVSACTL